MELNQRAIAREVANKTGFSITDIENVFNAQSSVIAEQLSKGNSIKMLKLYKIKPVKRKGSNKVYDGIHKKYYNIPEHYHFKFVPLTQLNKARDTLNK